MTAAAKNMCSRMKERNMLLCVVRLNMGGENENVFSRNGDGSFAGSISSIFIGAISSV